MSQYVADVSFTLNTFYIDRNCFWYVLFLGKLEALAILLQKLRAENRRVLIFTQMLKMLDILEAFIDYRQLTYVRIDENFTFEERQVNNLA